MSEPTAERVPLALRAVLASLGVDSDNLPALFDQVADQLAERVAARVLESLTPAPEPDHDEGPEPESE